MLERRRVNIEIDELVLDGFNLQDGKLTGLVLEQELSSLILKNGLDINTASNNRDIHINSISVDATSNFSPRALGSELARALYAELKHK